MTDPNPNTATSSETGLAQTDYPVRPKAVVSTDDFEQPRKVEWGHLRQNRGVVEDDRVRIERQKRRHQFGAGTHDAGPPLTLYEGSVGEALVLYRALDALFTGGTGEVEE